MSYIEFNNYSAFYKLKRKQYLVAINNLTLSISDGDHIAVLGPSGCGKTTFLKSIMGFNYYSEGNLFINGKDIDKLEVNKLNFSYVSQQYCLYPHFTIYDNIAFALKNKHISPFEINERVIKIAKALKIDYLLTRKPFQLSIGQQQRVAIARAIISGPELLLLDEPFSNLDSLLKYDLYKFIKAYLNNKKTTLIIVTQDIEEAKIFAERFIFIKNGGIEKESSLQELLELRM